MSKPRHNNANPSAEASAVQVYLRLISYSAKHWKIFTLSVLSLLILSATNTGFLATIKLVTDEGFVKRDAAQFSTLPFILLGLMLLRSLSGFIANFSIRYVARRVVESLRLHAFSNMMSLPVSFFDANSVGNICSKITYDTEQMSKAATNVAVSGVRDTFTIIGIVAYMLYLDWRLTIIFVTVAPLMGYYLKAMTPKMREAGKQVQQGVRGNHLWSAHRKNL
jgi:subfamily B ATP-binding cassette protein MsbA